MRMFDHKGNAHSGLSLLASRHVLLLAACLAPSVLGAHAQTADEASLAQKVEQLTEAMARAQAQLERAHQDLEGMRRQLVELRREMAASGTAAPAITVPAPDPADPSAVAADEASSSMTAAIQDLRERQAMQQSQIATEEQTKVESESKYPVKITGILLMNGFVNTSAVDMPASPSLAIGGSGSAGATVRQTILGFDARGPHLFGASSFADLRVDFFGSQAAASQAASAPSTSYSGYNTSFAFLRLRTAHAGLEWDHTQAFFALDRSIINPDGPTSLTAMAVPALAWSGNLWTWSPQAVLTEDLSSPGSTGVQLQAALIDVGDAPLTPTPALYSTAPYFPPTSAEQSSKPGVEARVAWHGHGLEENRMHVGVGGYFAEHDSAVGNYDSWASTLDARLPLLAHLELAGNFYRGAALGGLGAGAYKDFAYSFNSNTGGYYLRPLDDVGGWAQLKEKPNERLEFNAAYGIDNVFAGQLRRYYVQGGSTIQNLTRNQTFTGNVIYSPSAYLLFSLEYRRLESTPVEGEGAASNIFGVGAGYKF